MSELYFFIMLMVAAIVAVPLFKKLRLGAVLGYLFAGAVLGPLGFDVVHEPEEILHFSEIGVVMLLFIIGLELAPDRIWKMRGHIFGLGALQVGLTSGVIFAALVYAGLGWQVSLILALALSLSSTAFVIQLLNERNEFLTPSGQAAFSVLLFQDLAAIPILSLVALLAASGAMGGVDATAVPLTEILLKVGAVIAYILVGFFALPYFFNLLALVKVRELFLAGVLVTVLGSALLMDALGLSMALGAFIAGVLLSESHYRHELEADIDPFKGLLLGLFFIAVGATTDFSIMFSEPLHILSLVAALVLIKAVVLYLLAKIFHLKPICSRHFALILAQGGEFAFVIISAASQNSLIEQAVQNTTIVVVSLSMMLTPVLLLIYDKFLSHSADEDEGGETNISAIPPNRVIIAGFGRYGQMIGRLLSSKRIPYTALDANPSHINFVKKFGSVVHFGDARRLDVLIAAGVEKAEAFVLSIDDFEDSVAIARMVKRHNPGVQIYARARNRPHVYALMDAGVDHVYRETLGSSMETSEDILLELGMTEDAARRAVRMFREQDEKYLLQGREHAHDMDELARQTKIWSSELEALFEQDQKEDA